MNGMKRAFAIGIGSALTKGAQDGTDRIIVEQTRAFVEDLKYQSLTF